MPVRAEPAVARLTTTEAAVLALLAIEGERSAYDLVKLVEKAIAHIWSPARSGLYAVLPRLVRDGLAQRRVLASAGSGRPDKQLYRISREGRRSLDAWLQEVEPGARDPFFLKLFVGKLSTPEIEPTNANRDHDWYHRHLLRYGIERAELELEWADRVARDLRRGPR